MIIDRRGLIGGGVAACVSPSLARAQAYPARPIRLLVGFPPGAAPDVVARLVGPALSERLGQPVVIENRPGAGSNIATQTLVRAAPDGYTLQLVVATNTVNSTLYQNLDFDFARDVAPVASLLSVANVVAVPTGFPAITMPEFIDHARKNPGKVNMASSGVGTATHITGEMFKAMAGVDMVHVPYSGNYFPDLIAGQVQVAFTPLPGALGFIRAGQLRVLAVTTAKRSDFLPDVPTLAEFIPGFEASGWYGLVAPANTSAEIVATLNRAANAMVAGPLITARLPDLGAAAFTGTPDEFGRFIVAETDKWAKVIRAAGIKAE